MPPIPTPPVTTIAPVVVEVEAVEFVIDNIPLALILPEIVPEILGEDNVGVVSVALVERTFDPVPVDVVTPVPPDAIASGDVSVKVEMLVVPVLLFTER